MLLFNRAGMTVSGAPGTGAATLLAAITTPKKYLSFADAGVTNGDQIGYLIEDGAEFEFGYGLYATAGPTLTRSTVRASSNAGALISATSAALAYIDVGYEDILPTGAVTDYAGSTAPAGWLLCDGSAVSRATYAALFSKISTTFGVGDGSTTFNVPDCRGKAAIGAGTGSITETRAAANWNTSDIITVASPNKWATGMAVTVSTTGTRPGGISTGTYYVRRLSATTISLYDTLVNAVRTREINGSAASTTGIMNITSTGSGDHTLNYALSARTLAETMGAETHGLSHDELPTIDIDVGPYALGSDANAFSAASPTLGNTSTGSFSGLWGADTAHNNMQPSITLNKIIKT